MTRSKPKWRGILVKFSRSPLPFFKEAPDERLTSNPAPSASKHAGSKPFGGGYNHE